MSEYIIATSSTSDLPRTWLEEHKIPFIAYSYIKEDQVFEDDCREESRDAIRNMFRFTMEGLRHIMEDYPGNLTIADK